MRISQRLAIARWSPLLLVAAAAGVSACDSPTPTDLSSNVRLEAASPTELTGTVRTDVAPVPTVRAVDDTGAPVPGIEVRFTVAEESGSIDDAIATTDAEGLARVARWTLGRHVGSHSLVAVARTGVLNLVEFRAVAGSGPPVRLVAVSGSHQFGLVGEALAHRVRARVEDADGNLVQGHTVEFDVTLGGGSLDHAAVLTDSAGVADGGFWTMGSAAGPQEVRAQAGGLPAVVFSAYAYHAATDLRGRLAFVSDRDGDPEIYAIDVDGTGLERLTAHNAIDQAPAWSPDGSRIAFISHRDRPRSIHVMAAGGSNVTRLSDGSLHPAWQDGGLSWSPDGTAIAFATSDGLGTNAIAALRPTDGGITTLSAGTGWHSQPAWSPDGEQIAYVSDRDAYDFVFNIYTMNVDGSDHVRHTEGLVFWPDLAYYFHPTWSPDGSMLAFVYGSIINDHDIRMNVAVLSLDDGARRDLAWAGDHRWLDFVPDHIGSLAWSPDGSGVAFSFRDCNLAAEDACPGRRSIRFVSIDGTQQRPLVDNGYSPSWRP